MGRRTKNETRNYDGSWTGISGTDIYNSGNGVWSNWLKIEGQNQATVDVYFTQGSGATSVRVDAQMSTKPEAAAATAIVMQEGDASAPPAIDLGDRYWTKSVTGDKNFALNHPISPRYTWIRYKLTASGGSPGASDVATLEVGLSDI